MRTHLNKLEAAFGSSLQVKSFGRSDRFLVEIDLEKLTEVAAWLRMEESFRMDFLESFTIHETKNKLIFSYFLCSHPHSLRLVLRTSAPLPEEQTKLHIKSIVGIWPQAEAFESELGPLFGIDFTGTRGSGEVRKIFGNFVGYPLRKNYEWGERIEP